MRHPARLAHFRTANFADDGVSAAVDWRYELVPDYLMASHSYLAIRDRIKGRPSRYPVPTDHQAVLAVYRDFGDFRSQLEYKWWETEGKLLFGLKAPLPKVTLHPALDANNKATTATWTGVDSLVLTVPATLTLAQAMKQIRRQLASQQLAAEMAGPVAPKYQLLSNRLRQDTLMLGAYALSRYRQPKPPPLWKIGHDLELVPTMVFQLADERERPEEYAHEKATLATAARRLIRQAIWIAENAARGRFFTDDEFPEALIDTYKRKAGRPVGTARKKTKNS
jgi:predicted transcriptional regulator